MWKYRKLAKTVLCLFFLSALDGMAQQSSTITKPLENVRLRSIEVSKFDPTEINRSDFSTVEFRLSFDSGQLPLAFYSDYAKELQIVDASGGQQIAAMIAITKSDGKSQNDNYAFGTVTVAGSQISMISGLFGRSLAFMIVDPKTNVRSNQARLRVSGFTNLEALSFSTAILISLTSITIIYYSRYRRRSAELYHVNRILVEEREDRARELSWKKSVRGSNEEDLPGQPIPAIPHAVLEQLADGMAVLGLGVGLSIAAGMPDRRQTLLNLVVRQTDILPEPLKKLVLEKIENSAGDLDLNDYSDLLEAIASIVGRSDLIQALRTASSERSPDLSSHDALAALPWAGALSFTHDELASRAFDRIGQGQQGSRYRSFLMEQGDAFREALQEDQRFLLRVFGDPDVVDSVALTLSDLRTNIQLSAETARQVTLLLDTRSFLFLGVPLDTLKEFLQPLNRRPTKKEIRHYAVVPFDPENARYSLTLEKYGVRLLEYDGRDGTAALKRIIIELERQIRGLVPNRSQSVLKGAGLNPTIANQRLRYMHLENIGPFRKLSIDFEVSESETAPHNWTVIMGQNGIGKTGILRALAVALVANEDDIQTAAGSLLGEGASSGHISVVIGHQTLDVSLVRDRTVRVNARQTSPVEAGQILVLGFPALRGGPSSEPKGPKQLKARPPEPADLTPLITGEVDPRMAHFKQWIVNVLSRSVVDSKYRAIRDLLDDIVAELVPGDFAGFADLEETNILQLRRRGHEGVVVPFSTMSQGMASIFNWIGLLAKRLYDVYEIQAERPPQQQHAIVIIDEIDAHLHPDWQRRVVALTKKFFPHVQVIATTHSPLIASSLETREIRVIELDDEGNVSFRTPSIRTYGQSADFIMQSDVMGLQNARTLEVEQTIQEYVLLYSRQALSEEEDFRLASLRRQLMDIGWVGVSTAQNLSSPEPSEEELQSFIESYKPNNRA